MGKRRKISLNISDIEKTIKDLKKIEKDIDKAVNDSLEEIIQEAVEYCKQQSGNFEADTYYVKTDKGYRIVQEGYGVIYVEFGTGVVGDEHPHNPMHEQMGLLPHNAMKEHKFIAPDGREAWFYPKGDGTFGITSGQPARMQMYKTAKWLEERLGRKVKYDIERGIREW